MITKDNAIKYLSFIQQRSNLGETYTKQYKNGKNRSIKSEALRNLNSEIDYCKRYLLENPDLYILASGGESRSDSDRADYMHEFGQHNYYTYELDVLIKKLNQIINSQE